MTSAAALNLSVIVPTRDRADLLEGLLSSLAVQTCPAERFEVLVVDNGSRDRTKEVAASFSGRIRNLRCLADDRPGLHVGRHLGMKEAGGEILVFADDDVEAAPSWLEGVDESFREDGVVLAGGRNLPKFEAPPPEWILEMWKEDQEGNRILGYLSILDLGEEIRPVDPELVYGCNFSIRKTTLLEAGGFHPDSVPRELIRYRGDGESHVSRHIRRNGYKALYHPKASVHHRVPGDRLTEEYFLRRAFNQGISDSYTEIRERFLGAEAAPAGGEGSPSLFDRLKGRSPRELFDTLLRKCSASLGRENRDRFAIIHRRIAEAYREGRRFHAEEVSKDPALLEWVVKERYFDD